jgi:hypothetical protein
LIDVGHDDVLLAAPLKVRELREGLIKLLQPPDDQGVVAQAS